MKYLIYILTVLISSESFGQLPSDHLFRTGYYYLNVDSEKSIDYLTQAIQRDSSRAKYYYFRGIAQFKRGEYKKSIADFDQANGKDTLLTLTYMYAGIAYKNLGDYDNAILNIDKYIEYNKIDNSGYAHLTRGRVKLSAGDLEGAVNDFTLLSKSFPESESASYYRLLALQQLGDHAEALDEVNKLIELNSEFYGYYFFRGNVQMGLGNFDKAMSDYSTSIKYNENNADAYFQRGVVLDTLNRYDAAILNYTTAIGLNSSDGAYYSRRGNSRYTSGNPEGACLDWTIAGNLGYYENFAKVKRLCE